MFAPGSVGMMFRIPEAPSSTSARLASEPCARALLKELLPPALNAFGMPLCAELSPELRPELRPLLFPPALRLELRPLLFPAALRFELSALLSPAFRPELSPL